MKIENETKFGTCKDCGKLKPRQSLVGANIHVYGSGVNKVDSVIRIRLCPKCFKKFLSDVNKLKWVGRLHEARHIRIDEELSSRCDEIEFDNSQNAILAAADETCEP